jgi:hypothetical protein
MNVSDIFEGSLEHTDTGKSTAHTTAGLAVASDNGILFSAWAQESVSVTYSATSGQNWTLRTTQPTHYHCSLDKPFTSAGNYTATVTTNAASSEAGIIVAFNKASGGGGTITSQVILLSGVSLYQSTTGAL